MKSTVVEA
jgi:hypothetical protein